MHSKKTFLFLPVLFLSMVFGQSVAAQQADAQEFEVITDKKQLRAIVPASFYFAGLSGGTQLRNSAVGRFGEKRHIVAGLVDVSGYSTDISGVYEGFFITDSPVAFGDKTLGIGAYGIGFAKSGKVRLFDLSGKQILSTATTRDTEMRRPRPLMMTLDKNGIRLYKGRDYVLISPAELSAK